MTVGEKIQFYRKKIGLSQDDLGKKLLVSRQTVSLWEMDKTLPTVDNLIRLKGIFSVSIDDILNESMPIEEENDEPNESYRFQYSESDLQYVSKKLISPYKQRTTIAAIVFAILLLVILAADTPDAFVGFFAGYFLFAIVYNVKGYLAYKKTWKTHTKRVLESVYLYEIYDDYFVLTISKNDEVRKTLKISFDEIEKIQSLGEYIILQHAGQSFIIKKEVLTEKSFFHSCGNKKPEKSDVKKARGILKAISILLFVGSTATIWGGLAGVSVASAINKMYVENMWVFFLFTPVPIASVIYGFCLKHKGYKYKKNVAVGIIMAALLCIYGSFSFIFAEEYSHTDEPVLKIEETLDVDIPTYSQINTHDWTKGTQTISRGCVFSVSDIYFDENAVKEFEEKLPNDSKWISAVPNDIIGITSHFFDDKAYDYCIIYNTGTSEFNQLPSEEGTYRFINVMYNGDSNTMKLVEYEIEYKK